LATRDGDILHLIAAADPPEFAADLPPGRLRDAIGATIEPRRLFALARIKIHERVVRILNTDNKTVVRLVLQTRDLRKSGRTGSAIRLPAVVAVVPVKGYNREQETVAALLADEVGQLPVAGRAFFSAMNAAGLVPGGYESKPTLRLLPQMRADEAVRAVHQALLNTIVANTDGVRRHLDSEFLHDYRVAVRGTRALLKQVKGVFPASDVQHFSNEFRWLAAATGPVRDLDVYLLKMEGFRAELPADVREHLGPLETYLNAHHVKEQRRLVRTLGSRRYRALMEQWSAFLSDPAPVDDATCPDAAQPVVELAADRIWRAFRRVWKRLRVIDNDTPAAALHGLRIECKKLRYLLEFFDTIFPPDEVRLLIKSLKQLQTRLGNFNDCDVQRVTLQRFANDMYQEGLASADSLLAMGRLMDHLFTQQCDERRRLQTCFASFAVADNHEHYRRLFKRADQEVA